MNGEDKKTFMQQTDSKEDKKPVNSWLCAYFCFVTELTYFLQLGMTTTAINPVTPTLIRFWNETYVKTHNESIPAETVNVVITLVQSCIFLGAVFGFLLTGFLAIRTSRLGFLSVFHIVNLISLIIISPVSYITGSYECMIVGRFLNGFARGFAMPLVPVIISESTCFEKLALYQSPAGWLICLGALLGNVVGHRLVLGMDDIWPIALMLPAVFSLLFFASLPCFTNPPSYFIKQGKSDKAWEALKKLRNSSKKALLAEFDRINIPPSQTKIATLSEVFRNPGYRKQLFGVCVILLNMQLVGAMGVAMFSDDVFVSAGISQENATYATIGLFFMTTLTSVIGTFLIPKVGTLRLLIIGNVIICITTAMLTVSTATQHIFPWMAMVAVVAVVVYMIGNGIGELLVSFSMVAQITNMTTRATVMSIGSLVYWLSSWLVSFSMKYMLTYLGPYTWLVFFGFTLICTVYIALCVSKLIPPVKVKKDKLKENQQFLDKESTI